MVRRVIRISPQIETSRSVSVRWGGSEAAALCAVENGRGKILWWLIQQKYTKGYSVSQNFIYSYKFNTVPKNKLAQSDNLLKWFMLQFHHGSTCSFCYVGSS